MTTPAAGPQPADDDNDPQVVDPPRVPPALYVVNGEVFRPLDDAERRRQIAVIDHEHNKAVRYNDGLTTEKDIVDALARCMVPTVEGFKFFCNNFVFIMEQRDLGNAHKRFILYDYQIDVARETIDAIQQGHTLLEEKSRDMGASWLKIAVFTWAWLFWESFHALLGSRKEDLVDDKTVDSLFGKIDYIIERLPPWMLGGYDSGRHRKMLNMKHPRSGNLITGESSNPNFGRGPRKNVVYMDEFAFWESDHQAWTSVTDTAPCKIITSTPQGDSNVFATLRFGDKKAVKRVTLHWTLHPYKDVAWYTRECEKRKNDPVSIAQELNIDYRASAGRLALPQLEDYKDKIIIPAVSVNDVYNTGARFIGGFDWGSTNPGCYLVLRVRRVDAQRKIMAVDIVWEFYGPMTLKTAAEAVKNNPWASLVSHVYADPSMWFMNQSTRDGITSLAMLFRDIYGVNMLPGQRGDTFVMEQIKDMMSDIEHPRFRIAENCTQVFREMSGLRYQQQSSFMAARRNTPEKLVDKDNHSWDALKYALNTWLNAPLPEAEPEAPLVGMEALAWELRDLKAKIMEDRVSEQRKKRRAGRF